MKNDLPVNRIRLSFLLSILVYISTPFYVLAEELHMYAAAGVKALLMEMAAFSIF
jgi:hypothetical protein